MRINICILVFSSEKPLILLWQWCFLQKNQCCNIEMVLLCRFLIDFLFLHENYETREESHVEFDGPMLSTIFLSILKMCCKKLCSLILSLTSLNTAISYNARNSYLPLSLGLQGSENIADWNRRALSYEGQVS
jgi:hypothetical protein